MQKIRPSPREARSLVHLSLAQHQGMNADTNFQPIGDNPDSHTEFAAVGNVPPAHSFGSISQLPAMDPETNLQLPVTTLDSGPSLTAIGDSSAQGSRPESRQSGPKGPGSDPIQTSTNGTNLPEAYKSPFDTAEEFLNTKLFQKFDKIQKHLHWAGFPGNYGTFSSLRTNKGRQFKRVNDHGLHLLWKNETQYIKPLPSCFGRILPDFGKLKPCLRGLFHSYTKLIVTEFDFDLAIEERLLPKSFMDENGWDLWQAHAAAYDAYVDLENRMQTDADLPKFHPRYHFGSLRLPRLNAIMWLTRPGGQSHFHQIEDPLFGFWRTYGAYIALIFVYFSLALTAMQVALAADEKPDWLVSSFKYSSWAIIVLIIAQIPLFVIISLFWIFTTTAISPRFLAIMFSNKKYRS